MTVLSHPSSIDEIVADLKKERVRRRLKLTAVAADMGSTAVSVHRWETRQVVPSLPKLMAWSAALGRQVALVKAITTSPGSTGSVDPFGTGFR